MIWDDMRKTKAMRLNGDTKNMKVVAKEGKTQQIKKYRYKGSMLTADRKCEN